MGKTRLHKEGLTLVETALSLAIAGVVLVSLANVMEISKDNWTINNERLKLLQHSRTAMDVIAAELRYSTTLLQASSSTNSNLEFESSNLVDDDTGLEAVHYFRSSVDGRIQRRVSNPAPSVGGTYGGYTWLVGFPADQPQVQQFNITPLKLNASNILTPLTGGDVLSVDCVAVELDLIMVDSLGNTLRTVTVVKMRNKT